MNVNYLEYLQIREELKKTKKELDQAQLKNHWLEELLEAIKREALPKYSLMTPPKTIDEKYKQEAIFMAKPLPSIPTMGDTEAMSDYAETITLYLAEFFAEKNELNGSIHCLARIRQTGETHYYISRESLINEKQKPELITNIAYFMANELLREIHDEPRKADPGS